MSDPAPCRILVVDDEPDYRFLVRLAVQGHPGLQLVGEARSAAEGLELAEHLVPDVVLLDLVMPGMDGIAALPGLRRAAPAATVIATSAYPDAEVGPILRSGGSLGHLSKAVPPSRLAQEVLVLVGVLGTVATAIDTAQARLAPEPRSASAARRFVDETLGRWECDDLLDTVTLLVSELVTNAVIHARSEIEVGVHLLADRLRIEVGDSSETLVRRRAAADDEGSGRGMTMVETLAQAWGVDARPGGKVVWFELPRPDQRPVR
jgi:CheY-like chemotaxis protein